MSKLFWAIVQIIAAIGMATSQCFGQNFTCDNAELRVAAEAARKTSAVYWYGKELPRWSYPCPITYQLRPPIRLGESGQTIKRSPGGSTKFTINGDKVYGWRMSVEGSSISEVIPIIKHEVDHTVRASIASRKIARWIDEGSAVLFETEHEHERQRKLAFENRNSQHSAWRHFDGMEYPDVGNANAVFALYSTGFAVTEWLVMKFGRFKVVEFQNDKRVPSEKFADHFKMAASEAESEWNEYIVNRQAQTVTVNSGLGSNGFT